MANRVEKIVLNKQQTAFIGRENCNGVGVVSGSVSEIADVLTKYENKGCKIVFDTKYAPNFSRCFNAYVKRAMRIAAEAGLTLSEPSEYFIDGFRQTDKFFMEVV